MGDLGVSEHHQEQLVQFLRFCRFQRAERLRSVTACFDGTKRSRLNDSTFTKEEVLSVLDDLCETSCAEMTGELLNSAHTCLLLMRQVCAQAELWHLRLNMNLSELENRELLDAVGQFEQITLDEANKLKQRPQVTSILRRLEPLELGAGAAPLLQTEIERLRHDNEQLRKRVKQSEQAVGQSIQHKDALRQNIDSQPTAPPPAAESTGVGEEVLSELQQQLQNVNQKLNQSSEQTSHIKDAMQAQLTEAHQRLLQVKEQLSMTEAELEKKFSATAVYKNMKQMLMQKNKQLRDVRRRLDKYEPQQPADGAEEEEDD